MKPTYTVKESDNLKYVERVDPDGAIWAIPMDEANSDYQRYLEEQAKPSEAKTK